MEIELRLNEIFDLNYSFLGGGWVAGEIGIKANSASTGVEIDLN